MDGNKFSLNSNKNEFMAVGNTKHIKNLGDNIEYKIKGHHAYVHSMKYLGIQKDDELGSATQIDQTEAENRTCSIFCHILSWLKSTMHSLSDTFYDSQNYSNVILDKIVRYKAPFRIAREHGSTRVKGVAPLLLLKNWGKGSKSPLLCCPLTALITFSS